MENIQILPERGQPIKARFNPEHYTVSKSVQYAEIGIPGLDSPILQYVRGQNEHIAMELFFDTTDQGMMGNVTDVRDETTRVYALLKVNPETHAPLRVTLLWGQGGQLTSHGSNIPPWLVLESVSEDFTLFSPDGIPLRARLNVTFREAWTVEEQLTETPRHSSDRTKLHRVQRGETLSHISWIEYGDPHQWRTIADSNQLDNPRLLRAGAVLQIPRIATGSKP